MVINDRMLTAATGILFAMSAGAISVMMTDRPARDVPVVAVQKTQPQSDLLISEPLRVLADVELNRLDPADLSSVALVGVEGAGEKQPIADAPLTDHPNSNKAAPRFSSGGLAISQPEIDTKATTKPPKVGVYLDRRPIPLEVEPTILPGGIRPPSGKTPSQPPFADQNPVEQKQVTLAENAPSKDSTAPETSSRPRSRPEQSFVFAAVHPNQTDSVGPDLATISVSDIAPQLAVLASVSEPKAVQTPEITLPLIQVRISAVQPAIGDGLDLLSLPGTPVADCGLDVRATRLSGARVALRLTAPCHPDVIATIEHAGLRFKERLNEKGILKLKVPVFEQFSRFDIQLSDGTRKTVGAYITDLSRVERVGISFAGKNDTFLHAYESGAGFNEQGHVWRVEPRNYSKSRALGGGYMTLLGDPALPDAELAQVYSIPQASNAGAFVALEIETLRDACSQELGLAVAARSSGRTAMTRRLVTKGAACGSGDSLMLKNAVKAINVAAKR